MTSGIGIRLIGVAFAIVFAFVTELPAFETPCPIHDPAFARLATSENHVHSAGLHQATNPNPHHQKSHGCTCIGCGCCVSAFTLASTSLSFVPAAVAVGTDLPLPPIEKHSRSIAEHERPFSTAPPLFLHTA